MLKALYKLLKENAWAGYAGGVLGYLGIFATTLKFWYIFIPLVLLVAWKDWGKHEW